MRPTKTIFTICKKNIYIAPEGRQEAQVAQGRILRKNRTVAPTMRRVAHMKAHASPLSQLSVQLTSEQKKN